MYSTRDRSNRAQMRKIFGVDGDTKLSSQKFPVRRNGNGELYAKVCDQQILVEYNSVPNRRDSVMVRTPEDQAYVLHLLNGGDPRLYPILEDSSRPEEIQSPLTRRCIW